MATAPLPFGETPSRSLPDYLPARMVNEFVYCPRLFFYEFVESVFADSADTLEGSAQHKRVDKEGRGLPAPEAIGDEDLKTRAITLASEEHKLIAKMDLLEVEDGVVRPVDYKHGKPREGPNGIELWPTDRVQLAVQAIILRENGYQCDEGLVYYATTKQRARVQFTDDVMAEALRAARDAWEVARAGEIPLPLVDSPKCPGCSLVGICLPDEVNELGAISGDDSGQMTLFRGAGAPRKPAASEPRRLIAPRVESKPAYLNTQGLRVGRSGGVLQVKEKDAVVQELRLNELCQLNLMGNIQVSTQAVQSLCDADIPICYFSQGGWFYGITTGLCTKNVFLRKAQFRLADGEWFCRRVARQLTAGKIRNQRTMLLRNHVEPDGLVLAQMKEMAERAEECERLDELLGIEGNAARLYFSNFSGMIKVEPDEEVPEVFRMDFTARNRRPPRDAVNALLSLGYSLLVKDFTIACYAVGFDPMIGFYHQPRFGRPALALDLMEPFRPLVADSAVLSAINTRMVTPADFVRMGPSVALRPQGRKAFYRAYELRMDTLVTHPLFEYRVSYRRMLEIQARLLGKMLQGEVAEYAVFVTR
ncbi:MAG TPA: CRISPR-associated endonuclease Cas1 [Bryobacteraceae bacterium]|nr:CRISPR-associated endonuclease Cas1 [Bryobacteraceae bacterium]